MTEVRAAAAADMASIRALLDQAGLPTGDLASSQPRFIVASGDGEILAVGALQRFGSSALLRSVAVAPGSRGAGLGRAIVQELERMARASGTRRLILLTESAEGFFDRQRFRVIDRKDVPADVQACEEFRSLCPASATCMAKELTGPA